MKKFLILQLRPNRAGDFEYKAFCEYGGLREEETHRIELTQESIAGIDLDAYAGVIVGGGAPCVSDKDKSDIQKRFEGELANLFAEMVKRDVPYLGACYGFGIFADYLQGVVEKNPACAEDVSAVDITLTEEGKKDPLTSGLPETFKAFVGHKESCTSLPQGAVLLASSKRCANHMFRYQNNMYATQFHPELDVENMLVRIEVYKHDGYFKPEDAQKLTDMVKQEQVHVPMLIMKQWVDRYRS